MKTYQDLQVIGENEKERMDFVLQVINQHKSSDLYRIAADAELYYRQMNPTIMKAQKIVYDLMGRANVDLWSANNKIPSRFFFYFITQATQFLLGNGVSFNDPATKERLGKSFDKRVQDAAIEAQIGGVSFGYLSQEERTERAGEAPTPKKYSIQVYSAREFAPLYDEETGALRAGVRFWQVADNKPLRATLFEPDGKTEYIKNPDEEIKVLQEKQKYVTATYSSLATGIMDILDGENYPNFPVVPLWNINKQSSLVGARETIDAYDLMASALINNVDDANIIYWVIKNAGGMDDMDDQRFIERLKTLHVVHTEGEEQVDAHNVDVPFQASEVALDRLRSQLFDDFMALDVKNIAGGAATATQIKAAYEPLNSKTDLFEYQVTEFIDGILKLAGIEDEPTYTRSMIINQQETITNLVAAAEYLSEDYITQKVLEVLGDVDKLEEVRGALTTAEARRYE